MLLKREGQRWVDMSAEDLVSEALVRYLNGSRVRPADLDLLTFLIGIMRSIKSSYVQRHVLDARHFGQRVDDFTEADFVIDTLAQPETEVSAVETMSLVRSALKSNSVELAVFDLTVEGETSSKKIAQSLGLPITQVESARRSLRRKVSRLLDDRILMARYH